MKTDPRGVLTGVHYLDGDFACGEGALAAGCRFVAGYPITPSTEVAETLSKMQADGEHDIVMIPADGEHGAAGICYGAALGGGCGVVQLVCHAGAELSQRRHLLPVDFDVHDLRPGGQDRDPQ